MMEVLAQQGTKDKQVLLMSQLATLQPRLGSCPYKAGRLKVFWLQDHKR